MREKDVLLLLLLRIWGITGSLSSSEFPSSPSFHVRVISHFPDFFLVSPTWIFVCYFSYSLLSLAFWCFLNELIYYVALVVDSSSKSTILLECILLRTHRHACTCSHAMYLWGAEMPLHWLRAGRQDIESLKRGFAFLQRRLTLCWLVQSGVCLIPVIEQFLERGESDKGGNGVPLGNAIDMAQTLPAK